ncbi:hypothetical protein LNV23_19525 [Paucibacter sp. DJ1R-11]|uniref:hypothetical protein n=1 Tax=Paucibacter sp. DJ1R-11 TaxID=2893556 RepID=UPI0021E41AFD|nr:hypothetical protein [Paucibacter sp. DJ1R-11]MCV2365646.1 hypothetical protein [Paucibacter sp. DJ1R-11]
MDMNLTSQARYRRLAWGLLLAGALALLSLALIGGLFAWLMDSVSTLGSAQATQTRSALPLLTGLTVVVGLLLRWRLRSGSKNSKRREASKRSDTGL